MTWRRSARSSGGALGALDVVVASTDGVLPLPSLRSAAIASSNFTRCPSDATPSSFRFSCVKLGRTVSSMSFSRKTASYFPRPKLRSQTTTSMTAPTISGAHIMVRLANGVQQAQVSDKAGTNSHQHGRGIWRGSSLGHRRRPLGYAGRAGRASGAAKDPSFSYRAADFPNCTATKDPPCRDNGSHIGGARLAGRAGKKNQHPGGARCG